MRKLSIRLYVTSSCELVVALDLPFIEDLRVNYGRIMLISFFFKAYNHLGICYEFESQLIKPLEITKNTIYVITSFPITPINQGTFSNRLSSL